MIRLPQGLERLDRDPISPIETMKAVSSRHDFELALEQAGIAISV
jgi:hypothetical protein